MQQIASGFKSAEVTSATISVLMLCLLAGIAPLAGPQDDRRPIEGTAKSRAVSWHTAGIAISGAVSFTITGLVGNW
jgi:hypothetical protein